MEVLIRVVCFGIIQTDPEGHDQYSLLNLVDKVDKNCAVQEYNLQMLPYDLQIVKNCKVNSYYFVCQFILSMYQSCFPK